MLHHLHRFHGYGSLDHVYRHGQTVRSQSISLKWITNSRTPTYRAAVIVSKKVAKSAPRRNRIRRRIYEVIRQLPIQTHIDIAVSVFDERITTLPYSELETAIRDLCEKARILA